MNPPAKPEGQERINELHDLLTRTEAIIANHPDQRFQTAGVLHVPDDLERLIERERSVNANNRKRADSAESQLAGLRERVGDLRDTYLSLGGVNTVTAGIYEHIGNDLSAALQASSPTSGERADG